MADQPLPVGAVVLAAGLAQRMGRSKLDLPWPQSGTVLGRVLDTLLEGGVNDCVVVTGGYRQQVETVAEARKVRLAHNAAFETTDMLASVAVGLNALETRPVEGALIMPADHPLVHKETVAGLIARWREQPDRIWVPSHKRRRGHPLLVPRAMWPALTSEKGDRGLRSFLDRQEDRLKYFNVNDPGIRMDVDDSASYEDLLDTLNT